MAIVRRSAQRRAIRLKREMLRDAVAENLAVIGAKPWARKPVRRRSWLGWALATAVAASLVGSLTTFSAARGKTHAAEASRDNPPTATEMAVPAGEPPVFAAPHPIDPALFRLAVRKVVIDPGHGGSDPGAMVGRTVVEKDITLDIARRLATLLRNGALTVVLTREGDETLSLQQRVLAANTAGGDVFLSIHVNFIPVAIRRGVETYYLGPSNDPHVEKLARVENSGSGYSLADFRKLLEGVYADVRQEESRRFAEAVQAKLWAALHRANPVLEDRGVKKAPFVVLVGTEMPSVLAEVSCISNPEEVRLLGDDAYREDIATALAAGVRGYAAARSGNRVAAHRKPGAS